MKKQALNLKIKTGNSHYRTYSLILLELFFCDTHLFYYSCLKPLGLNFMLNTNCGVIQSRKRSEYHRRRSKLHVYGKTAPARQCKFQKTLQHKMISR